MERVAIIGAAQTRQGPGSRGTSLNELIYEATSKALEDAGISRGQIDSVVLAAHDLIDGRGITNMTTATAAGAHTRDEIRVSEDGLFAAALANARLASGHYRVSLVVAWTKIETDLDAITPLNFDPFYQRPVGLNEKTALALQASRYADRYQVSAQAIDNVILRNRQNGSKNQNAHLQTAVTKAELGASAHIAYPLRSIDFAPYSEGACAVVMASSDAANIGRNKPVWIVGSGRATDSYYLGTRELSEMPALRSASQRAYGQAGIKDPIRELDVIEIHAVTPHAELIAYEEFDLCKPGAGADFGNEIDAHGYSGPSVNPSGGALCSNPYTATGLVRLIEVYSRIRKQGLGLGLAHGSGGIAGQGHCVFILSRD